LREITTGNRHLSRCRRGSEQESLEPA
jgi:hypothetical protein